MRYKPWLKKLIPLVAILLLTLLPNTLASPSSTIRAVTYNQFDSLIYRAKGSVVFVCIYTSTCPACNQQMPLVNYLGKVYGEMGLTILALASDESSEQVAYYLKDQELYFEPLWLSQNKSGGLADIMDDYDGNYLNRIPYTAVIDRSGKVIKDWTGVTSYNNHAYWIEKALGLRK